AANAVVRVLGKSAHTPPPSFPPVVFSIASRWAGFGFGSMYTRPVPLPMWIARGHHRPQANVVPSNFVAPYAPFRMCQDTSASQLPVVGSASKLHGHPHAQLQLWMYSASKFHFVGIERTPCPEEASGGGYLIVFRGRRDSGPARTFLVSRALPAAAWRRRRGPGRRRSCGA